MFLRWLRGTWLENAIQRGYIIEKSLRTPDLEIHILRCENTAVLLAFWETLLNYIHYWMPASTFSLY